MTKKTVVPRRSRLAPGDGTRPQKAMTARPCDWCRELKRMGWRCLMALSIGISFLAIVDALREYSDHPAKYGGPR